MPNPEDEVLINLRASFTRDEAVAKLLGWMRGPIYPQNIEMDLWGIPESQLPYMASLQGSLQDHLTELRQAARQRLIDAAESYAGAQTASTASTIDSPASSGRPRTRRSNSSAGPRAEAITLEMLSAKEDAVRDCEKLILRAQAYLNDIEEEFAKGTRVSKVSFSLARSKIGAAPLQDLVRRCCVPMAEEKFHPEAFYRGMRLVAMDGSNFDLPDESDNEAYFGRPGSRTGVAGYPQARCAVLAECTTHAILAANLGPYALPHLADAQPRYRLLTTLLDPAQAPALELAAVYHQRWKVEEVFDELKTHLLRSRRVLRSKTAELVRQEFYGWVLAHYAVRWLLHQGATRHRMPHDGLSFASHVQLLRREQAPSGAFPPSKAEAAPTPLPVGTQRKRPLASQPDP